MLPIQGYITNIGALKNSALTQQTDAFGDPWEEHSFVGVRRREPFDFTGFYDDVAASGPHVLFGNTSDIGAKRYMEVDKGASDVENGRVIIQSYAVMPVRGELHQYTVSCLPTGAWATTT